MDSHLSGKKKDSSVKMIANVCNNAVVQISGRTFPGVVIQGDSFSIFVNLAKEAVLQTIKKKLPKDELYDSITELYENLAMRLKIYEAVLKERKIPLPYNEIEYLNDEQFNCKINDPKRWEKLQKK